MTGLLVPFPCHMNMIIGKNGVQTIIRANSHQTLCVLLELIIDNYWSLSRPRGKSCSLELLLWWLLRTNWTSWMYGTFHPDNMVLISIPVVFLGRTVRQPPVCFRVQVTGDTEKQTGRINMVCIDTQIQIKTTHTINISLPCVVFVVSKHFAVSTWAIRFVQRRHPTFRKTELLCCVNWEFYH